MPAEIPESYWSCYQCKKCSAGCPVGEQTDLPIDQIIGWLRVGDLDRILQSEHIWLCTGCHACSTRCPNDVDPAALLDFLRVLALSRGIDPPPRVRTFHDAFIRMLKKRGRSSEIALMSRFYMKHGIRLGDIKNGIELLKRGRLKPFGIKVRDRKIMKSMLELEGTKKLAHQEMINHEVCLLPRLFSGEFSSDV